VVASYSVDQVTAARYQKRYIPFVELAAAVEYRNSSRENAIEGVDLQLAEIGDNVKKSWETTRFSGNSGLPTNPKVTGSTPVGCTLFGCRG
jgi:hypothetical protein